MEFLKTKPLFKIFKKTRTLIFTDIELSMDYDKLREVSNDIIKSIPTEFVSDKSKLRCIHIYIKFEECMLNRLNTILERLAIFKKIFDIFDCTGKKVKIHLPRVYMMAYINKLSSDDNVYWRQMCKYYVSCFIPYKFIYEGMVPDVDNFITIKDIFILSRLVQDENKYNALLPINGCAHIIQVVKLSDEEIEYACNMDK